MKKYLVVLLVVLLSLSACSKKSVPGIETTIALSPEHPCDFQYVKADVTITLNDKFTPLGKGYDLFLRLLDAKNKKVLVNDQFTPPQPTAKWIAGKTISFSRVMLIPPFSGEPTIDLESNLPVELKAGLVDPAKPDEEILLAEKKLTITPATYSAPQIVYESGFYDPEIDTKAKDPFFSSWHWTTKKAVCILENIGKPAVLIINGRVDKALIPQQKITLSLNDKPLAEFSPAANTFRKRYILKPEMMGKGDEFTLTIETDKTAVPADVIKGAVDKRELGVAIYPIYFREFLFPVWEPETVYGDGWYGEEKDPRSPPPYQNWRWTAGKALCQLDNPRAASMLTVVGRVNKSAIPDQKITIRVNDAVVDEFLPSGSSFTRKIALTPEILGANDQFDLVIEVDKTFVPAQIGGSPSDSRQLGLQIFSISLGKKAPLQAQ